MSNSKLQIKFIAGYPTRKCLLDHVATCNISIEGYLFRGKRGHQNQERIRGRAEGEGGSLHFPVTLYIGRCSDPYLTDRGLGAQEL